MKSESWQRLSAEFEKLCDEPPAERERRLAELATSDPGLAGELAAMLAADRRGEGALGRDPLSFAGEAATEWEEAAGSALSPGTMLGPWRLVDRLGAGGMGEVWGAERADGAFEQKVALKLLKRGLETDALLARFARERQILARLNHPGIARLLDAGASADGRPWFVMERVEGVSLTAWAAERSPTLEARLRLLLEVCAAVDFAHRNLIVHRDLKPSNVLVDASGAVKLLDFGIAKLLASEGDDAAATLLEERALTPAYAAPEQIRGEPVTTATDVYALGVLAYELLAGRLPHRRTAAPLPALVAQLERETVERPSDAVLAAAGAQTAGDPAAHRQLARRLAGDLDNIVLKALAGDPARRYPTAAALASDLELHLAGRPVTARADSVRYRTGKFISRHRFGVAATFFVLIALVAGLVGTTWQARRASENAERAEQVKRFLVDVFRQVDPTVAQGREITAREVLESGSARLESELAGSPALAADLNEALSQIYASLGVPERAADLAERAVDLRESRLPFDEIAVARSRHILGEARMTQSRPLEAFEVLNPVHETMVRRFGIDSLEVAEVELALSASLNESDRMRALEMRRHVVAVRRRLLGEDHLETLIARRELADMLDNASKFEEAEAEYRSTIAALERVVGPRDPRVAEMKVDYADVLHGLGRLGEAEPILRDGIAVLRDVLGPRHPGVAHALLDLSIVCNQQARHEEARAAIEEMLTIWSEPGMDRAFGLRDLGSTMLYLGRLEEGAELYERSIPMLREFGGESSPELWRAVAFLGDARTRQGKLEEAERDLRLAVSKLEINPGPKSYQIRMPLRILAENRRRAGDASESIAILRRVRALEIELFGTAEHRDVAVTDRRLGIGLTDLGTAEALTEARTVLDHAVTLDRQFRAGAPGLGESLAASAAQRIKSGGDLAIARAELEEALVLYTPLPVGDVRRTEAERALTRLSPPGRRT